MPWITKIELRGFKSFGNTKVEIPLAKGLTAIIGRNGHGKSNIVDALCFVFGGRSVKSMRGERYTDFIYTRNNRILAPYAEVTIHINNQDGKLPVGSNTVVISRRVDRTGRCTYRINGKRVDQKDIIDLLAPVMGGPNDVNFVMQGQIKKIFAMNSVERRQIIDQLAGVSEYDDRKKETQAQLEHVTNNLQILRTRAEEIQRRVNILREQARAYVTHRDIKRELEKLEAAYNHKKENELKRQLQKINTKLRKKKAEAEKWKNKAEELNRKADVCEQKANRLWELIAKKQQSGILTKVRGWEASLRVYQRMLREAKEKHSELERKLEQLKNIAPQATRVSSTVVEFRKTKTRLQTLLSQLSNIQSLAEARRLAEEIAQLLQEIERLLDSALSEIGKRQLKTADIEKAQYVLRLTAELELHQQNIREFGVRIEELKTKLQRVNEKRKTLETEIDSLKERNEKLQQKAHELRVKARELYNRAFETNNALSALESKRAQTEQRLRELSERKTDADYSYFIRLPLSQLLRRIEDLNARLKELGEVNPHALEDLKAEEERFLEEERKVKKLEEEQQSLLEKLQLLDQRKKEVFMNVFNVVAENFRQIFYEISGGCRGELVLENPENPFEGGLDIRADFDGGPSSGISGGQKTLIAVALLLALQQYRPSTLYVLDEMDESLDPQNRRLVAKLLKEYSKKSQILVVTLHNALAAVADRVFGVVKDNGVSKIFSVELTGMGD